MSYKSIRSFASLVLALTLVLAGTSPALAAPPTNDDFDSAIPLGGVPVTVTQETFEATTAFDDPLTCTNNGSVWFSFTPPTDMTLQANTFGSDYDTVLSAYTGTRGALTQVSGACNDDYSGLQSRIVFNAVGGTTYYFLVGVCCGFGSPGGGNLTMNLQQHELQPPVANIFYFPGDPSVYDNIQFISNSFDPEGIGIQTYEWDFGDGATSQDPFPIHKYATDGDYTVQHSVTTFEVVRLRLL